MPDETTAGSDASSEDNGGKRARRQRKDNKDNSDTKPKVSVGGVANQVRSRLASLIWILAVLAALFLAVGALTVALKMNQHNSIVHFIHQVATRIDLGQFKTYDGKDAAVKSALTNWGIAAVIYLVIGKVLDRIIRP